MNRREVLQALAAAFGVTAVGSGYLATRPSEEQIVGGGGTTDDNPRFETLDPLPGGTAVAGGEIEGYGTLAGGITRDGKELIVTNRHVVDAEYPDSDDDEVVGNEFRQPWNASEVAEVVDVGRSKGTQATDWALIKLDDSEELWTPHVIGLPEISGRTTAEVGDRIVMSGARTGLIGGEVTDVDVSRNWLGTILNGVIEYRVDEDRDTAGNSGSWVAKINGDGETELVGIHTFSDGDYRYCIPVDDLPSDVEFDNGSVDIPTPTDSQAFVEGAVSRVSDEKTQVAVSNVGGETVEDRAITLLDADLDVVDTKEVTLSPLETQLLDFEPVELPVTIDTADITRSTEYSEE